MQIMVWKIYFELQLIVLTKVNEARMNHKKSHNNNIIMRIAETRTRSLRFDITLAHQKKRDAAVLKSRGPCCATITNTRRRNFDDAHVRTYLFVCCTVLYCIAYL